VARPQRATYISSHRYVGLLGWTLAGACLALAVSQIGFVTIPVGVLLVVILAFAAPKDAVGFLEGVGIVAAVIGAINLDYHPCPRGGTTILKPGQTDVGCGGFDGAPWLIGGTALAVAVFVLWSLLRRRASPSR
jgi:hypothetical protein